MARNSARSSIHSPAAVKKASTRNSAECTGLRAVITPSAAITRITAKNQKTPASNMDRSAVGGVRGAVAGDLLLVAVAHREQHFLGVVRSPRFSPWYSRMRVSTIESTGQDSSHRPQKMHLVRSMS